jgi:TetR/AcrR family transcriptional regulator, lmrAB and yxaGH operons repressor
MEEKLGTKDRIVKAATILFQTKGYHATGLNEILRESNAPKGSLYYYFPNGKEQLALEAINQTKTFIEKTIRERLDIIQDPAESIKNSIEEMADNLNVDVDEKLSFRSTKKVSINLIAMETATSSETLRIACESAFKTWQNVYYQKMMDGGFERKRAEKLSLVIQTMIEGAIIMSLTMKSDVPLIEVAKQIPIIVTK